MDYEQKEALRERNRRRGNCPKCGNTMRELTTDEIMRRDDTLAGLRYKQCGACGTTTVIKGRVK